jgi:hypothetical protein
VKVQNGLLIISRGSLGSPTFENSASYVSVFCSGVVEQPASEMITMSIKNRKYGVMAELTGPVSLPLQKLY